MPLVASVDYATKRIYLTADAMGLTFDTMDVYREVRALRRVTESHRKHQPMIVGGGNIQKTPTTYTQPYVQLLYGATLVPVDLAGKITLIRETFSDDGRSAAECFDRSVLVSNIDIDVQVPAVEVRTVTVGGGSTADIANAVLAILQPDLEAIKGSGYNTNVHSLVKIRQQAALAAALSA